jgi:two-component system LytT family response regulator
MKTKYKVVIIDDEPPARNIIKKYLEAIPDFEVLEECSNGFEGVKIINEIKPDLIFLDIQMPKISGFEMLELLDEKPVIIFTTAFDEYALKAFEVNAADYLLKPFSFERFNEAVKKSRVLFKDDTHQKKVIQKLIKHHETNTEYLERVVIKTGARIEVVPIESVFWLEAQDDYVMIHSKTGNYLKQKTMKFFEQHLDPNEFIRIHRSHIIRISYIKQIEPFSKMSYQAILKNGNSIPISKAGYHKIKSLI